VSERLSLDGSEKKQAKSGNRLAKETERDCDYRRRFAEGLVLEYLAKLREGEEKRYLRRKNAVEPSDGAFYTLREQRSNHVPT